MRKEKGGEEEQKHTMVLSRVEGIEVEMEDGYDEASKISRALLRSKGVWVCSFGGAIVQPARI
jgi:hypothetical protein